MGASLNRAAIRFFALMKFIHIVYPKVCYFPRKIAFIFTELDFVGVGDYALAIIIESLDGRSWKANDVS